MTARERGGRDGYVMLEAMVSGALLAIALGTAMSFVGHFRVETTMASRKAEASTIASGVADELVARPFGIASQGFVAVAGHAGFQDSWDISQSGLQGNSTPALLGPDELHIITVNVKYPTQTGTATLTYQRLKRRF